VTVKFADSQKTATKPPVAATFAAAINPALLPTPKITAKFLPLAFTPIEGISFENELLATFTSSDPHARASDYLANIDWGDGDINLGSPDLGVIQPDSKVAGQFDILGSHAYDDEGSLMPLTITITGPRGAKAVVSDPHVSVSDAVLRPGAALNQNTMPGTALDNVQVATFRDLNIGADDTDFTATIDWGDGTTSAGTVAAVEGQPGSFTVTGSHTYASAGVYTVVTTINDVGGASTVSTISVFVAGLTMIPFRSTFQEGWDLALYQYIATYVPPAGQAQTTNGVTATIAWGDGQSDQVGIAISSAGTAQNGHTIWLIGDSTSSMNPCKPTPMPRRGSTQSP
jgi:hypothetical protein